MPKRSKRSTKPVEVDYVQEALEPQPKKRAIARIELVELLNSEEINWLIDQSHTSKATDPPKTEPTTQHLTYSFIEVAALMAGNYHPSMFKKSK